MGLICCFNQQNLLWSTNRSSLQFEYRNMHDLIKLSFQYTNKNWFFFDIENNERHRKWTICSANVKHDGVRPLLRRLEHKPLLHPCVWQWNPHFKKLMGCIRGKHVHTRLLHCLWSLINGIAINWNCSKELKKQCARKPLFYGYGWLNRITS